MSRRSAGVLHARSARKGTYVPKNRYSIGYLGTGDSGHSTGTMWRTSQHGQGGGRKLCGRPGRRDSSLSGMGRAARPISLVQANSAPRAVAADDRAWVSKALCRETDPDEMFVRGAAQRKAAVICRHCPVVQECAAEALDNKVEFGIWGGMTERQRRALLNDHPEVVSWTDFFDKRNARSSG